MRQPVALESPILGLVFCNRLQDARGLRVLHGVLLHHLAALDDYVKNQNGADDDGNSGQKGVKRQGVVVEDFVAHGVDCRLEEVHEPTEADDGAVDAAESCEAEDLGCVIAHGGIVQRSQQAEEDDIDVSGPHERERAKDADRADKSDKDGQKSRSTDAVEQDADERSRKDTTKGKRDIEERVDLDRSTFGAEHVIILAANGRDEVIHAQHLENSQGSHQDEPGSQHLLHGRLAVESTPNTRSLQTSRLLLFSASTLFLVTDKLVQLVNLRLAMLATAFAQASDFVVAEFLV